MRSAAGRVSGNTVASSSSASTAATITATKTARQPNGTISALPVSGARIGETLNTSMTSDISRVASTPVWRSRMIARGITIIADAPSPCTKRNATSQATSGASAQPMDPAVNSDRPTYSGGLRPTMSDTGP